MRKWILPLLFTLLLLVAPAGMYADSRTDAGGSLIAAASKALVAAGDKDWGAVNAALAQFDQVWAASKDSSAKGQAVEARLDEARKAVKNASGSPEAASQAISALAKAADQWVSGDAEAAAPAQNQAKAREKASALVKSLEDAQNALASGNLDRAKKAFNTFNDGWGKAEGAIRADDAATYGSMEVKISSARISLSTEPLDADKAKTKLAELTAGVRDYAEGRASASANPKDGGLNTISDLIGLSQEALSDVKAGKTEDATSKMERFIAVWPSLEGEVSTRSSDDYSRVESHMVRIPALLESNPPKTKEAEEELQALGLVLEPYANVSGYTAWDAALILLREGVEAILVIGALLTFLKRSGHDDKRKWIWTGAWAGILVSAAMAVVLSVVLSGLMTGSSRELIEGITGLVAVAFMLTVGAWLHKKSNLREWNLFVKRSIGESLARGTLWSLAFTAFLAVMREGAETLIFYIGMAPSIEAGDLALGIGGALIVLGAIGYAIIALGSRIPVRPFFLLAGILLYYLAFKFGGTSIHALQVAGRLGSHPSDFLPEIPSLGIYSNWETTLPQLAVLAIIAYSAVRTERSARSALRSSHAG